MTSFWKFLDKFPFWTEKHAKTPEKRKTEAVWLRFMAGAGGFEPATHGFGVAKNAREALKMLAFSHVSTHFSHKTVCRGCV